MADRAQSLRGIAPETGGWKGSEYFDDLGEFAGMAADNLCRQLISATVLRPVMLLNLAGNWKYTELNEGTCQKNTAEARPQSIYDNTAQGRMITRGGGVTTTGPGLTTTAPGFTTLGAGLLAGCLTHPEKIRAEPIIRAKITLLFIFFTCFL